MQRFVPLFLIVLALAAVPAAFADNGTPTTLAAPASPPAAASQTHVAGAAGIRARIELLRLRLRVVRLEFALHCRNGKNADRCQTQAQNVVTRLTTLDGNVQQKIADLQSCTSGGTDPKCKNADRKIALLQKVDTKLQNVLETVQGWLSGNAAPAAPTAASTSASTAGSPDSSLDAAANALGQLAASNG